MSETTAKAKNNDAPEVDENKLIAQRREKLAALRAEGQAFPNGFRRDSMAAAIHEAFAETDTEALEQAGNKVRVAGRMMSRRVMGKVTFAHLQDMSGRIQLFVQRDGIGTDDYKTFKGWDIGDIVGASGTLFRTKTGELSVRVDRIELLTKSLRPLPEKYHGLTDVEMRYRQRYVDLIMNEDARAVFRTRAAIINTIRQYLNNREYLEVETPMMQAIPGGAAARPFATHHNALDMPLFLRIAPELYLKRLVVGGFERVYEINRSFRNEGVSTRHNPEFTMLEFYQAYTDYYELMDMTEELVRLLATEVCGGTEITWLGHTFDVSKPFRRMTVRDSILHFNPDISATDIDDRDTAWKIAEGLGIPLKPHFGLGKLQLEIYEKTVEHQLQDPTFITAYPTEVSPLARTSDSDPFVTDRFEFIVCGQEVANGVSELNDAEDQAERFRKQVEERVL